MVVVVVSGNQIVEDYRAKIRAAMASYGRENGVLPMIYRSAIEMRNKLGDVDGQWVFAEFMAGDGETATGFIYDSPIRGDDEWICKVIVNRNDLDDVYLKSFIIRPLGVLKRSVYDVVYLSEKDVEKVHMRYESYQMKRFKRFMLSDYYYHARFSRISKFGYEDEENRGLNVSAYVSADNDRYSYVYIESDSKDWLSISRNVIKETFATVDREIVMFDRMYVSEYSFPHKYVYHVLALKENVYI